MLKLFIPQILLAILAIVFLSGRGSFLIAGFNTMPKSERDKYDKQALCRFVGKLLLIEDVFLCFLISGGDKLTGLSIFGIIMMFVSIIIATVYTNTGNRFKK